MFFSPLFWRAGGVRVICAVRGWGGVVEDPKYCKLSYPFKLLVPYQNLRLLRVHRARRSCLAIRS